METTVYNQKGEESGKISLPEKIFGLPWNADLVHQVVSGMLSNKRSGTANTKGRSEVRGGGKKPWKQKGTGRARHGSSRSPIWIGGGITHGPRAEKNYKKKINSKMKIKALYTALSAKFKNNELFFVDKISLTEAKTKKAKDVIQSIGKAGGIKHGKINLTVIEKNLSLSKSFRNIPSVYFSNFKKLNPVDVLQYKYLIIVNPEESIKFLEGKMK
ncbi:MAG: 50S ribosomal protein L4 [Candidatus Nomurabacteria bacterium GW2011_GWB1_37_5]|uniref:Large ribosomal subunit protein uL4 n=1 Tax=Candidatus Nomurabacteria bacterium GW2011_GWB1_37_5 TaxID=1618742 RepID=A0A0G0GW91_9BACT|nr:MAG: 50S ribosomal protein L4 [Candidatus Nomurabacteria bacterium GW2011_GWB1_37_5]